MFPAASVSTTLLYLHQATHNTGPVSAAWHITAGHSACEALGSGSHTQWLGIHAAQQHLPYMLQQGNTYCLPANTRRSCMAVCCAQHKGQALQGSTLPEGPSDSLCNVCLTPAYPLQTPPSLPASLSGPLPSSFQASSMHVTVPQLYVGTTVYQLHTAPL